MRCFVCYRVCFNWCKRCRAVAYCSTKCQRQDWKAHRSVCGLVRSCSDCGSAKMHPNAGFCHNLDCCQNYNVNHALVLTREDNKHNACILCLQPGANMAYKCTVCSARVCNDEGCINQPMIQLNAKCTVCRTGVMRQEWPEALKTLEITCTVQNITTKAKENNCSRLISDMLHVLRASNADGDSIQSLETVQRNTSAIAALPRDANGRLLPGTELTQEQRRHIEKIVKRKREMQTPEAARGANLFNTRTSKLCVSSWSDRHAAFEFNVRTNNKDALPVSLDKLPLFLVKVAIMRAIKALI